jgi:hypothetical protein
VNVPFFAVVDFFYGFYAFVDSLFEARNAAFLPQMRP